MQGYSVKHGDNNRVKIYCISFALASALCTTHHLVKTLSLNYLFSLHNLLSQTNDQDCNACIWSTNCVSWHAPTPTLTLLCYTCTPMMIINRDEERHTFIITEYTVLENSSTHCGTVRILKTLVGRGWDICEIEANVIWTRCMM